MQLNGRCQQFVHIVYQNYSLVCDTEYYNRKTLLQTLILVNITDISHTTSIKMDKEFLTLVCQILIQVG